MNLDTNYWCVQQKNFTEIVVEGSTIKDAIFKKNGNTFQNSPIHLMFYEKIKAPKPLTGLVPNLDESSKLASMSYCKLKKDPSLDFSKMVFDINLLLVLKGFTAQFVTNEQY